MKLTILVLLLLGMVLVAGCNLHSGVNGLVSEDAKRFCENQGFDGFEFVQDSVSDGKFYCVNESKSKNIIIEKYYQGVKP